MNSNVALLAEFVFIDLFAKTAVWLIAAADTMVFLRLAAKEINNDGFAMMN